MKFFTSLIKTVTIASLLSFFLLGCSDEKIDQSEPFMIISDSRGVEVTISKSPERVISLGPNMTEIIFALGKGDLIVGRTDYCDYPEKVKEVPSVGDIREPNIEQIIELDPDVIFASTHVTPKTIKRLEQLDLCVIGLEDSGNFEGLHTLILNCARILSSQEKGLEISQKIQQVQNEIIIKANDISKPPSVYFALGFGEGGDWTAGADTFIDDMITITGGFNIVENRGWSYSKEMLIENDPDIILIGIGKKEEFISSRIYKDLSASQNDNVYEIDEDIITRTSPRSIEGLKIIQDIFFDFLDKQK